MESIWINGENYRLDKYLKDPEAMADLGSFEKKILSFSVDWLNGAEIFTLKTSGSTGTPKTISIRRSQLVASARMTTDFLNLQSGERALLCLDPRYIAGIMMMVRSFTAGMSLYALSPSSNPLLHEKLDYSFDLTALVPYQVVDIIHNSRSEINFRKLKNILIGGSEMSPSLIKTLSKYPNSIFQTFGMTETVSHIALKRISGNNPSDCYETMAGIRIDTDSRGCLTVSGAVTGGDTIITNDLIELLDDRRFRWKGRIDDVIITGGIKVNIQDLESRIQEVFLKYNMSNRFFISKRPDPKLGYKIIMVMEKPEEGMETTELKDLFRVQLAKYETPKEIYTMSTFSRTKSGKIDKKATLEKLGMDLT